METGGREDGETGLVMKKKGEQKSTTGIGASLTPDYRNKEKSNSNNENNNSNNNSNNTGLGGINDIC